ncbi:hypothetical protein [Hymenobacter coccineus]|uniref:Uncharacterized protein n=1 Tax=Hymenobacter coccineus TaxID=1908235 RepID=A0A1G1SUB5_9BACT|nr:hypothetical protein [Hymenobacter coccineus]OGX82225.1 hypothetical protein BEN49_14210 [Hymenobacter coccineus]
MTHNSAKLTLGGFALLLSASAASAQATPAADECEKLKIEVAKLKFENANLRKGLLVNPEHQRALATSGSQTMPAGAPAQMAQRQTVQKVDFALAKCEGNAKSQTVTVTLLLTNAGANRDLQFDNVKAVDSQGEEYKTFDIHIGAGGIRNGIATGVPIKAVFIIPKVLSSTKSFKLLSCPVYDTTSPGRSISVEFRDVAIAWK